MSDNIVTLVPVPGLENTASAAHAKAFTLPSDSMVLVQLGIFLILLLAVLYFVREVAVPIVAAFVFSMLLQPLLRWLERFHVPRVVASMVLVLAICASLVALSFPLSAAINWLAKAPEAVTRIEKVLHVLKGPLQQMEKVSDGVEKLADGGQSNARPVTVKPPGFSALLFSGTRAILIGFLTTIVLLFFLLLTGDLFLRRLIEILPTLSDKKQAVQISREIETNISQYLVTITLLNMAVGAATGMAMHFCGLPDPILWGTIAFLLNYIPIIGPLCNITILFLVSLLTFDTLWPSFIPAGIYLAIHLLEGQFVTPWLLARRFTLNPVLVIVSIVFWYWMWGVAGAFLAVPMLAAAKIVADRIVTLEAFGHFLGTESRGD